MSSQTAPPCASPAGAAGAQARALVPLSGELWTRQALTAVQQMFDRALLRGERGVGLARLGLCSLALMREFLWNGQGLLAGVTRDRISASNLLLGIVLSVPSLRIGRARSGAAIGWRLRLSITADAMLVFAAMLPVVIWPGPQEHGLVHSPFLYCFPLAVVASGLRLSRSATLFSGALNLVLFSVLLPLERAFAFTQPATLAAIRSPAYSGHIVFVYILLGLSCLLAYLFASRTRHLLMEGARTVIESARVRARLGAYLSPEVVEEALQADEFALGGRRQEVAVLFSDLRGFTAYSERLAPEQLVTQLNDYLTTMVTAIQSEGGVVDKYIGDGIMAVFGAPAPKGPQGDDAARALRAAAAMQRALRAHNQVRAGHGLPSLDQGIGVHFGSVVAGNVGTPEQAQYTIIGDTVNLASRLETATKELKVAVLLSGVVCQAARRAAGPDLPAVVPCGTITVRGRQTPVEVWTLDEK